jgi:hypothetical protein
VDPLAIGKVVLAIGEYLLDFECLVYWDLEGQASAAREDIRIEVKGLGQLKVEQSPSSQPSSTPQPSEPSELPSIRRLSHFSTVISGNSDISFLNSSLNLVIQDVVLNSTSGPIATFTGNASAEVIDCRILANSESQISRPSVQFATGSALFLNTEIGPLYAKGSPAIGAYNSSLLNITNCKVHDVWAYAAPPSSAIVMTGPGLLIVDKTSFATGISLFDASYIVSEGPSFTVTHSNFTGGLSRSGYVRFEKGSGSVSDCIFSSGITNRSAIAFTECQVTFSNNIVQRTTPSDDASPTATISGLLMDDSIGTVAENYFVENRGSKCSAVIWQESQGTIRGNIFYNNYQTSFESQLCLTQCPNDTQISYNTFYDPIVVEGANPDVTWGFAMSVSTAVATIHTNDYRLLPTRSAVWISGLSRATIKGDFGGTTSSIAGLVLGASNLILEVAQLNITGPTAFITTDGLSYTSLIYASNGYSRSTIVVFESKYYGTWLQHVRFNQVTLDVRSQAIVCCSASDAPADEEIIIDDALLVFRDVVSWYASSKPVTLLGVDSTLVVAESGILMSVGPTNTSTQAMRIINGDVFVAGQARMADVVINGIYYLLLGGSHYAYPSHWRGRSHPTFVNGPLVFEGDLLLDEDLATNPFLPALNLTFPPSDFLTVNSTVSQFNPANVYSERFYWELQTEAIAGAVHYMVEPTAYIPYPIVDNTGGAILAEFSSELDTSSLGIDSRCNGFIPRSTSQFDLATLHCTWLNDTFLRISSTRIPYHIDVLDSIETDTLKKSMIKIKPAQNPVQPIAVAKPIPLVSPCGSVTIDGSLSTGLGSLTAWYYWTVSSDGANVAEIDAFLDTQSITAPRITVPTNLFQPGISYYFYLRVFNWMLTPSDLAEPIEVKISNSTHAIPLISIEGGQYRVHYTGNDLIISTRVDSSDCVPSDALKFEWSSGSDVISRDSPTLFVPKENLVSGSNYTFRLVTSVDTGLGVESSTTEAYVMVIQSPFYTARTGRSEFFPSDSSIDISVEIRTLMDSPVICSWNLYACPSLDVLNPSPLVLRNRGGVQDAKQRVCQRPNGQVFVFPVPSAPVEASRAAAGVYTCTLSMSRSALGEMLPGSYQFQLSVQQQKVTVVSFRSFENVDSVDQKPPSVSIVVPRDFGQLQTMQKLYFWAQVNGVTGAAALEIASLDWNVTSGILDSAAISSESHDSPTLVIPYSSVLTNEELHLVLTATSRATGTKSSFETSLRLSTPPFGGSFSVSPANGSSDSTLFTLSALKWSTLFPPLKFQYSIVEQGNIETFLSPLMDDPLLQNITIGTSSTTSLQAQNVTLRLTVVDALGTKSIVDTTISLVPLSEHMSLIQLETLVNSHIPRYLNLSDWVTGSRLLSMAARELKDSLENARIDNQTVYTLASTLVTHSISFTKLLPLTEVNTALALSQLKLVASIPNSEAGSIRATIQRLVNGDKAKFGTGSGYSWISTMSLVDSMASTLSARTPEDASQSGLVVSILSQHGDQMLSSLLPGEKGIQYGNDLLTLSSKKVNGAQTEAVQIDSGSTQISFSATQFQSISSDRYLGYHVMTYNGTFPGLPEDAPFQVVSHLVIQGADRKRSPGRVLTNFSTTVLETEQNLQCAKYDSTTNTWSAGDCTTRTASGGNSVVCDCSASSAPLSLIFGLATPSSATPSGKAKSGLSSSAIVAIVVVLVVLALVAAIILLAMFVPAVNRFFRPFLKRSQTRGSTLSASNISTVEMDHVDRNTVEGGMAPSTTGGGNAWSKAKTPT